MISNSSSGNDIKPPSLTVAEIDKIAGAAKGMFPRDNQDEELELEGTLTLEFE